MTILKWTVSSCKVLEPSFVYTNTFSLWYRAATSISRIVGNKFHIVISWLIRIHSQRHARFLVEYTIIIKERPAHASKQILHVIKTVLITFLNIKYKFWSFTFIFLFTFCKMWFSHIIYKFKYYNFWLIDYLQFDLVWWMFLASTYISQRWVWNKTKQQC